MPLSEEQHKTELERVETPIGLTPSKEDEVRSFGEIRERHQHWQFWIIFGLATIAFICLYYYFFKWLCDSENNRNWHIGLILIIPATTILLSLIAALRYKKPTPETDDFAPQIQQTQQLVRIIRDVCGPMR